MTKEELLKGLNAIESLVKEQESLRKDGLLFIHEQGLWEKFMDYHSKKYLDKERQV